MKIEVINTGTELLLGKVVNTHLAFLGEELFKLGLRIRRQTAIPDGDEIREALESAFPRCDLILVTGGLGPTSDDITRETVAAMLGRTLHHDEAVWAQIREYFRRRDITPSANNERQAMVPEGAVVLENSLGTAPGLFFPRTDSNPHLFLLPGPPRELKPMFRELVAPNLNRIRGADAPPRPWRNFKIFGVGESVIAREIETALNAIEGLEHGYCCRIGEVDVRLIGPQEALEKASRIVRQAFSEQIVTESETPLEQIVVEMLKQLRQTISTAESCTGGLIAHTLTNVPGSSEVFHRGYVTYANEAKSDLLGVPAEWIERNGAVSEPVVVAMAEGCLSRSGADHALAVSGIAGPGGGSPEKPAGTVFIALACRNRRTLVCREFFPMDRLSFKQRVCFHALDLLRRRLRKLI